MRGFCDLQYIATRIWVCIAIAVCSSILVAQNAPSPEGDSVRRADTLVRIDLIGDSTQTDNVGYGRGFCANLNEKIDCLNMAKGGASTKTFRQQRLWDKSLATRPDYMLIQFGHNDEVTSAHLEREVPLDDYEQNLRNYVKEARQHGIKPVLVTPVTRRYFGQDGKIHSDLLQYAETMKRVAAEMQVPFIDLQAESIAYLDNIGEVKADALGITKKDTAGQVTPDKTHMNWEGSYVFGRMVAVDLGEVVPALAQYVRPTPAPLPPEGVLAMRAIRGEPFKIVLVGDSTVATGGGWGPGFCALTTPNVTCIDMALNGRSSKSFRAEGAWKKALDERAQYYFIQFGHNDQKPDPARHADAATEYAANLHSYVEDARAAGAIPILVSPLSRRNYEDSRLAQDGLQDYALAARRVAAEDRVTFVDLYSISSQYLEKMTQEQADKLDAVLHPDAAAENQSAAKPDRTHLNEDGKKLFGRMVADDVSRLEVELGPNITSQVQGNSPSPALSSSTTMTAQ